MDIRSIEGATEVFEKFKKMNILIIGDVMIDSYLFGHVDRISPEAPVPIVAVHKRINRLGGAANVALNVKAMGARPVLCSVIGQDDKSETFHQLLNENDLFSGGILRSKSRITTTKFRVFGNNTQMLRVDEESTDSLNQKDLTTFKHIIEAMMGEQSIDAIIFQDYDKGVISPALIEHITAIAAKKNIPVTVDPKKKNFGAYKNLTLFKPNLKELKEGLSMEFDKNDREKLLEAIKTIHQKQHIELVLVTLSEDGVLISRRNENGDFTYQEIPAHRRSIADVSGAGDTVISIAAMCLAAGLSDIETAALSNLAGGQVCEFVGVVPVNRDKLLKEVSNLEF